MSLRRQKKITINLLVPFIVFLLFFSIMLWQKFRASQEVMVIPPQPSVESIRSVTLFFSEDGTHLTRETRELEPCDNDTACLKSVIDELINGPIGELEETVPEGVVVSSVLIEGDLASIGFNNQFSESMPPGSSAEMLAVYSVVNTAVTNFPQIKKVKIEVDGNKTGILHHLDISEPLVPDYTLEISKPPASEK